MRKIMYGCQTYPWKMNKEKYAGDVPHMIETAAEAGFQGLEAEIDMLGDYFERPGLLKELLEVHNLRLAAVVLHQDWAHEKETPEEAEMTEKTIQFVRQFPWAKIMVSHHAGSGPRGEGDTLRRRRENLISCMNSVAVRAADAGIVTCFHPNSSDNSLFRTEEDYDVLFEMLSKSSIGYAPDIGHIVNGGMKPEKILKKFRKLIRHVHYKDRKEDGTWAVMGEGAIDYEAVTEYLNDTGYSGWIMVEDESPQAAEDSDYVVRTDGSYVRKILKKGR